MEWDQKLVQSLSESFAMLLSRKQGERKYAISKLSDAADKNPHYALSVLYVVSGPSFEEKIRLEAAINFTNHLKTRWVPSSDTTLVIPDGDKEQIMTQIVPLILSAPSTLTTQLSKALGVLRNQDFRMLFTSSLPEVKSGLKKAMNVNDFSSVCSILTVLNVLCITCGDYCKNISDLDLSTFCDLLLSTADSISREIEQHLVGFSLELCLLIEAQRVCFRIVCVLNLLDVPFFSQKKADKWLKKITKFSSMPFKVSKLGDEEYISLVGGLKALALENKEKGDELFLKYLKDFVEDVQGLLVKASPLPGCDHLTVTAIKFLTIVSTKVLHDFFSADNILHQIVHSIVIPNVMLRDEDEELFQSNYVDFMSTDMEGNDGHPDTRRRIACELLKGIAGNCKKNIIETLIQDCLTRFAENQAASWKYKDCAIYLVVSLATENPRASGALISTGLVDVNIFFERAIIQELEQQDINAFPMLKAAALKFLTMLGVLIHIPMDYVIRSHVIRFLGSDMSVVRSYAARCIEKRLLVKDHGVQAGWTSMDFGPIVPLLMTSLFDALDRAEGEDNQYIMRCIMHLFQIADISSQEVASNCMLRLSTVLRRVCDNPKDPAFNHYLFEAVATLGPRACAPNPSLLVTFEAFLKPNIQGIFLNSKKALYPYGFQLISQIVDLRKDGIPPPGTLWIYTPMFKETMWGDAVNIPTLARVFESYFHHVPDIFRPDWRINSVFSLIEKLVHSRRYQEEGFSILKSTIHAFKFADLEKKVNEIWAFLFRRRRNPTLSRCLITFMSLFLVKHGIRNVVDMIEKEIPFLDLLRDVWIPHLKTIRGHMNVKLSAVASTRLICESQTLVDPSAAELWGKMLDGIVTLLSQPQEEGVEDVPEVPDFGEPTGYSFRYAGKKVDEDLVKEIQDPTLFCVDTLASLWSRYPRRFPSFISTHVSYTNRLFLMKLCNQYGIAYEGHPPGDNKSRNDVPCNKVFSGINSAVVPVVSESSSSPKYGDSNRLYLTGEQYTKFLSLINDKHGADGTSANMANMADL